MDKYQHSYSSVKAALNLLYHNSKNTAKTRQSRGRTLAGEHNIDLAYLLDLWKDQNGRCYYSNIPMNYHNNEWRVSIERLDNEYGYIRGNIALCCLEFNTRSQWSSDKVNVLIDILENNYFQPDLNVIDKATKRKTTYSKFTKVVTNEGISYKCAYCDIVLPLDDFYKDVSQGCKTCVKSYRLDRNPKQSLEYLLRTAKQSALIRGQTSPDSQRGVCNITNDDLKSLYKDQKGLCAYSGLPLQFGSYLTKDWVVSLERIDPTLGYTKDNICLICIEFQSPDQTVKTGSEYGSAGWTPLKFQYFLSHVKHKRGIISDDELQAVISIQIQYSTRSQGMPRRPRTSPRIIRDEINNILAQKRRDYGAIYSITSPSGKAFIEKTEILFQSNSAIFAHIRKYRYKMISEEIAKYGEEAMKIEKLVTCKKEHLFDVHKQCIESFNTYAPYGLNNSKRQHNKEAREKISHTLVDKTLRLSHDNKELPKFVKFVNWADRKGYAIISHPKCKKKDFVSKNKPLNELFTCCMEYLESLNE